LGAPRRKSFGPRPPRENASIISLRKIPR
jgi:hypothetical protein